MRREIQPKIRFLDSGFTLVELLMAIAIIGILAAIVLASIGSAKQEARDSTRIADLRQVSTAMELDYQDNSQYLSTTGGVNVIASIGTYLPLVPKDPKNIAPYQFTWSDNTGNLKKFCVYTRLEATTNGYVCASEKGMLSKIYNSGAPALGTCCY